MKSQKPVELPASMPVAQPDYQLTGLQLSDYMPIVFDGREYNLAKLTPAELDYLSQYPNQVPYIQKKDASQTSV
ncbi:hypothetical protein [Spirosoma panaciterrae]|uniref:hypothetical protein n=1 Tax=Spirosoma panaciterrae TaxID=496058 RepID=UPI000382B7D8|nr:hypothetical protein [Spirosoma panaciterrae]